MGGLIVLPAWLIASPLEPPRRNWGLRVAADQIVDAAPNADLRQHYPHDEVWEAPGQVLSPGFVDTHTHLYGVLAHGIPLDKASSGFWPFLEDFSPTRVWHTATEGGAKALGLKGVGRLEPGWQADFQLIAPNLPTPLAEHNLYDQLLLYCHATDVTATVVAGEPSSWQ